MERFISGITLNFKQKESLEAYGESCEAADLWCYCENRGVAVAYLMRDKQFASPEN